MSDLTASAVLLDFAWTVISMENDDTLSVWTRLRADHYGNIECCVIDGIFIDDRIFELIER